MEVWIEHSNTTINKLDPIQMQFNIPLIEMKGVYGKIYQDKPLQTPEQNTEVLKKIGQPNPLHLVLKKINLSDIQLDYRNTVDALSSNIQLGTLTADVRSFDLDKQQILIDRLSLNKTIASVRMVNKKPPKQSTKK